MDNKDLALIVAIAKSAGGGGGGDTSNKVVIPVTPDGSYYVLPTGMTFAMLRTYLSEDKEVVLSYMNCEYNLCRKTETSLTFAGVRNSRIENLTGIDTNGYFTFTAYDALPIVTAADNGKFLGVTNGYWDAVTGPAAPMILTAQKSGSRITGFKEGSTNRTFAQVSQAIKDGRQVVALLPNMQSTAGNSDVYLTDVWMPTTSTIIFSGVVAENPGQGVVISTVCLSWFSGSNPTYVLSSQPALPSLSSAVAGQILRINSNGGLSVSNQYTDLTSTLTAGATTLTISNSAIKTTSTIEIFTDTYGVNPTDAVVTSGAIVLTFDAQQTDIGVKVRVS